MEYTQTSQYEWQSIVETIEAIQSWIINTETTPQPVHNVFTNNRNSSSQASNYSSTPEAHLAPIKAVIIITSKIYVPAAF